MNDAGYRWRVVTPSGEVLEGLAQVPPEGEVVVPVSLPWAPG